MIRVGDRINRKIKIYDASRGPQPVEETVEAVVVYIHPERRFYVIECEMPQKRKFREAMYFFPRCGSM